MYMEYSEFLEGCMELGYTGSAEALQEAYEDFLNTPDEAFKESSDLSYEDALSFFVEAGVKLNKDQLKSLKDKADKKAYDTKEAVKGAADKADKFVKYGTYIASGRAKNYGEKAKKAKQDAEGVAKNAIGREAKLGFKNGRNEYNTEYEVGISKKTDALDKFLSHYNKEHTDKLHAGKGNALNGIAAASRRAGEAAGKVSSKIKK